MSRSILIRIAATLSLITCLGHTAGTFMPIPAEQTAMHATITSMKATMVPMPVGSARSYMQILDGNNLCTSLLLLFCAVLLFSIAGLPRSGATNRVLVITALGLAAFTGISALYFFPVPAVFTGAAAILIARSRSETAQQS